MASSSPTRIVELAQTIERHARAIDAALAAHGEPSPSWDLQTPPVVGAGLQAIRESQDAILEASEELNALMLGPVPWLMKRATDASTSLLNLHFLLRFGITTSFAPGAETSFSTLATQTSLLESELQRFVQSSFLDRTLGSSPTNPNCIVHTPISKALYDIPLLRAAVAQQCEEVWPAASRTVDAVQKWQLESTTTDPVPLPESVSTSDTAELSHTGWNLANNTTLPFYTFLDQDDRRGKQFADAMTFLHAQPGYEYKYVVQGFNWASLPTYSLVVDIGGNQGEVSFEVAASNPGLRFVVQDQKAVVDAAQSVRAARETETTDQSVWNRIEFMAHNYFEIQPVKGADVYMLRWVLHNVPDAQAVRILQNLVPALTEGRRVLIVEYIMPEYGVLERSKERLARKVDMMMKALLNAKERTVRDWRELLRHADRGFRIVDIVTPPGSELSLIEVVWEGKGHNGN